RFAIHINKQVFHCRGSDAGGGVIDMVMHIDGCDFTTAVETLTGEDRPPPRPAPPPKPKPKSDSWLRIWDEARSPVGTPVELHLAYRHLNLPDCEDIRFHPECPFGVDDKDQRLFVPDMVALVRHVVTNKPQGIHRTALDLQGNQRRDLENSRLSL